MTIREFENMLMPGRAAIKRRNRQELLCQWLNSGAVILIAAGVSFFLLRVICAYLLNTDVPALWILPLYALLIIGGIAAAIPAWLKDTPFSQVAFELDQITNTNNLIYTAYEYLQKQRVSDFARLAIADGMVILGRPSPFALAATDKKVDRRSLLGVLVVLVLCFVPADHQLTAQITQPLAAAGQGVQIDHDNSAVKKELPPQTLPVMQAEANTAGQVYNRQKKAQQTGSGQSRQADSAAVAGADSSFVATTVNKKQLLTSSDAQARNTAGDIRSGAGHAPDNETKIDSDLHKANISQEDQQQTQDPDDKNKVDNPAATRRPFTDDKQAAPGRELGRSGKNGKGGTGRGGQGGIKKARATAAIIPGEKIPVFFKSRPGLGRSKSFMTLMPASALTDYNSALLNDTPADESAAQGYFVPQDIKEITRKYFEELNNYGDR